MDSRAAGIPDDYKRKDAVMDAAMGVPEGEEGSCQRRLAEVPLITLSWGAYGEGSSGVHLLVTLLATFRVRTLALRGEPPSDQQMGLEVPNIRSCLSTAAVRATSSVLFLARVSQIGQGSGLASRRREWQRREEMEMQHSREADFLVHCTGQEIVRRGRFWGR